MGTPKGRLGKLEAELASLPWEAVREGIEVKLPPAMSRLGRLEALSLSKGAAARCANYWLGSPSFKTWNSSATSCS